MIITGN